MESKTGFREPRAEPSAKGSEGTGAPHLAGEILPKFSLVNEMMKELLSQFSGAIVTALTDEKVCDQAKALSVISSVADKFDAEVTLSKKPLRQKCSKCNESYVSKHSKSHLYCYKCSKDNDDIAEEHECIAPSKNSSGKCGRKAYGSNYCSIHKKWGEANDKGKVCKYVYSKGARKGKDCRKIIPDDSDEEYCQDHSRKGKCKGTNKEGNPCQFNAIEGEEYCQSHHNNKKKPSKKNVDDAPEEEEVIEKKEHKKQKQKKDN